MERRYFIVYNQVLDCFVKVYKLSPEAITEVFEDLDTRIQDPSFNITDFIKHVASKSVKNYASLQRKYNDVSVFHEAIYESVTEVYPMLTASVACSHYNALEEDVDMKPTVTYDLKGLNTVRKNILKNLIGQDHAVNKSMDLFKLTNSGFESFGSLFFIGPTGVGKTELARLIAKHYLGSSKKLLKINCSEYAGQHEYAKLIGSPPGYIGSNEKSILREKADESSQWVILFDEIEKASDKLHNLLLGFLDDGFVMDNHGITLDFTDSIFVFTTNIGIHEHVGKKIIGFDAEITSYDGARELVKDAFKQEFSPEFINRIDEIVYFNQLSTEDVEKITTLNLKKLPIKITKRLVRHVVDNAYSIEYGAREVTRFIKQDITLKLADKILEGCASKIYKPVFKNKILSVEGVDG